MRRNLLILYGAEFLGKVLGLAVFGYLGRALTNERYGDLEFSLGLLFVLNLLIDAGLANYGAREAARDPDRTDELVGQILLIRGALVVVATGFLWSVTAAVDRDPIAEALILLQVLALVPAPLILTWVFQARDQMVVVALYSLLRQTILAAGVAITVRTPDAVWMVPVWDGVGLIAGVVLLVTLFRRAGGSIRPMAHLPGLRRTISESAPLAASSIVWALRLFSPLLALGFFVPGAATAHFGAGHRLVISAHTFVWLYFFNILPSLSRRAAEPGLEGFRGLIAASMGMVGWVAICGASVGVALAPILIPAVYGETLAAAGPPFAVMMGVLALAFVSGHHRFGLIALSRQDLDFAANGLGAVVSVGACLALGTALTPMSAAMIFVVAEGVTWVSATWFLHRNVPGGGATTRLLRPLIATAFGVSGAWWLFDAPLIRAIAMCAFYAVALVAIDRDSLGNAGVIARRGGGTN